MRMIRFCKKIRVGNPSPFPLGVCKMTTTNVAVGANAPSGLRRTGRGQFGTDISCRMRFHGASAMCAVHRADDPSCFSRTWDSRPWPILVSQPEKRSMLCGRRIHLSRIGRHFCWWFHVPTDGCRAMVRIAAAYAGVTRHSPVRVQRRPHGSRARSDPSDRCSRPHHGPVARPRCPGRTAQWRRRMRWGRR